MFGQMQWVDWMSGKSVKLIVERYYYPNFISRRVFGVKRNRAFIGLSRLDLLLYGVESAKHHTIINRINDKKIYYTIRHMSIINVQYNELILMFFVILHKNKKA